jgi:hypothetical protein
MKPNAFFVFYFTFGAGSSSYHLGTPNIKNSELTRTMVRYEKNNEGRRRETDTYTINCVDENQLEQEVTSANEIVD